MSGSILLLLTLSCAACSLDEFEVCSNGAAETTAQLAAPVEVQSSQANQSEADTSPTQAPSETEDGAGGHDDSCTTDDDQFSEVGEAPDTEVMTALRLLQTTSAQAEAIHEASMCLCPCCPAYPLCPENRRHKPRPLGPASMCIQDCHSLATMDRAWCIKLQFCNLIQPVTVRPLAHWLSRITPFTHSMQQVVYVREAVAVWPTKSQRIMGRLSLIKQHQVMFLAWLPYSQGSLNRDGTFYSSATAEKSAVQSAKGAPLLKGAALLTTLIDPFTCGQLYRRYTVTITLL